MIRKILKLLFIVQERKTKNAFNQTKTERRINPYNPLSYIAVFGFLLGGIVLFGIAGVWEKMELRKEFKW